MAAALLSLVVTVAAAVAFAAWRQGAALRRWRTLRAWAESAGWRVRPNANGVPWPLRPPVGGVSLAVVEGRRNGHDVAVVWAADGGPVTVAYVRLPAAHPRGHLPRRRPTDPVVTVDGTCLAATHRRWLEPPEIDAAVAAAVAAAAF
jgi:hypothetical protein